MSLTKLPRATSEDDRSELKRATRATLAMVNAAQFSRRTRHLPPNLSEFGSTAVDDLNRYMPVDTLADFHRDLGRVEASPLLELLADIAGFKLVPKEEGDLAAVTFDDVGTQAKEGGEATAATAAAAARPTCLATVRAGIKENREMSTVTALNLRKLVSQERRLLGRAGA